MNRENGVGSRIKTWLLCHALLMGRVFQCFRTQHPIHVLSSVLSLISRLLISWSRIFGYQVTDTHTLPDPTFLEPCDCNKVTTDSDTFSFFFWSLLSVEVVAFHRSVMKNNILCEFLVDTYSDVDSDSDIPTPSLRKRLWFFPLVFTSEIGKSAERGRK
jgi:hypothetical protein